MKNWKYDSAADQHLSPREQMASLQREVGLPGFLTQCCWRSATRIYLTLYHRLTTVGRENLPERAPFILVCNHASHLDTLSLAAALPWRLRQSVFPIAAGDTFFETPVAAFFSAMLLNALPLWRRRCGRHALGDLRKRLVEEPAIYILFPEGTRSRDGTMSSFRPGIGMLIASGSVPIVPCYLHGGFAALPPGRHVPRPRKLTLRIGKRLTFDDLDDDRAGWKETARRLEAAVRELEEAARPSGTGAL